MPGIQNAVRLIVGIAMNLIVPQPAKVHGAMRRQPRHPRVVRPVNHPVRVMHKIWDVAQVQRVQRWVIIIITVQLEQVRQVAAHQAVDVAIQPQQYHLRVIMKQFADWLVTVGAQAAAHVYRQVRIVLVVVIHR